MSDNEEELTLRETMDLAAEAVEEVNNQEQEVAADQDLDATEAPSTGDEVQETRQEQPKNAGEDENSNENFFAPPVHWSKDEKLLFEELSQHGQAGARAQEILASKHAEMQRAWTHKTQKLAQERAEATREASVSKEYADIISGAAQSWRERGIPATPETVRQILEHEAQFSADPAPFIRNIIAQRGISAEDLGIEPEVHIVDHEGNVSRFRRSSAAPQPQAPSPQPAQPQYAQLPPDVLAQIQSQDERISAFESERKERNVRSAYTRIEEMASAIDGNGQPQFPFLQDLAPDMTELARLMPGEKPDSYYRMALARRPDLAEREAEQREIMARRAWEREAHQSASAAASAGASLPVGGVTVPQNNAAEPESIEEALKATWQQLSERDRL